MSIFLKCRLLLILSIWPFLAKATSTDEYRVNLQRGVRLYRENQLKDAEKVFRDLYENHRDSLIVLRYLGRIEIDRQEWGKARNWYKKIIDLSENDIEAHYYLGIAYRESGKYKAFIMQDYDWQQAERNFRFVVENIGPNRDIYYQYALLKKYAKDYVGAIELAEKQLFNDPDEKAYCGLHYFYNSFLCNRPSRFHGWVLKRTGNRSAIYLGESFRHREEFPQADSVFHGLLNSADDISRVPLLIALAKLKYQRQQKDSTQFYYEKAIESIHNDVDAALMFEDVKYVLSDAEWRRYRVLPSFELKRNFIAKMWVARDPMPASAINYRIIEHVARVIFAEKYYYFDGVRSAVNNPDRLNFLSFPNVFDLNDKYNDKGLVYIRHGQPDDRAFYLSVDSPPNETWFYYPRGELKKKLMFHFWQDSNTAGNNHRFIPSIPKYMADSRLSLDDPIFARLFTADYMEAMAIDHEMKIQSQEFVRIGMDTDQHSWSAQLRPIIFPLYTAAFRENPMTSRCELYFSLTAEDVMPDKEAYTVHDSVSINFTAFDMGYNLIERVERNIPIGQIVDSSKMNGFWPSLVAFSAVPGPYQFALDISTPGDEAIGGYKGRFDIPSFIGKNFKMSGLLLAKSITSARQRNAFYKNGLTVIPNPAKIFNRKKPIDVYFEIYDLEANSDKKRDFIVRYDIKLLEARAKGIFRRIGRILKNPQQSVSSDVERETATPMSVEYIALDLSKNVPGVYELDLSVFIPGKRDTVSRKIEFELK